ncbi:MAG: hypothetical protein QF561_00625 [Phycisphaerales bacterium]|nr:hypothetical protein [Phycisphaerales bacterium]
MLRVVASASSLCFAFSAVASVDDGVAQMPEGLDGLEPYTPWCATPGFWGEDYPPRPEGLLDFAWPQKKGTYLLAWPAFWEDGDERFKPLITMSVPGDCQPGGWSLVHLDQMWLIRPEEPATDASRTLAWSTWPSWRGRFGTSVLLKDGVPRFCLAAGDMQSVGFARLFGEGSLQLVRESTSVGTACCASISITALEPGPPRHVFDYGGYGATLMSESGWGARVPGGGERPAGVLVLAVDPHWQYWPRNRIDNAPPEVVLRVDASGAFPEGLVEVDAMRMERAAAEEVFAEAVTPAQEAMAAAWLEPPRGASTSDPTAWPFWQARLPNAVYAPMIRLFYTGHPDLAWQLLEAAWPSDAPGRPAVVAEFQRMLSTCPHYPQLPWAAPPPTTAGHFISLLHNNLQKRKNVSPAVTST